MNTRSHLFLPLLLLSVVSCAIVRTWPYHNQQTQCSNCTHANYKVEAREKSDGMFVGLALSGGGSRSANFSAAVMLELKRQGILQRVDFISSVSGGSLPAAYYVLEGYDGIAFEEAEVKNRMGRNFQQRWLLSWFNPIHILRYWFTDYTRSDIMVPVFDSNLFHDATFDKLNRERPKLLINATDSGTFERFTFSDEKAAKMQTDLSSFSIARAVNISSAFPGAFQTITVQDYSQENTYRHLYDGGPADNLGLDALAEVLLRAVCENAVQPQSSAQSFIQQSLIAQGRCHNGGAPKLVTDLFPDGCLVISVDAATRDSDRDAHRAHTRRWSDYIIDSNVLNATDVMLLHNRQAILDDFGIARQHVDELRFASFSIDGKNKDCDFWHIALRHIQPRKGVENDLGTKIHNIETSFDIDESDQAALFEAARRLVEDGLKEGRARGEGQGKAIKALLTATPGVR